MTASQLNRNLSNRENSAKKFFSGLQRDSNPFISERRTLLLDENLFTLTPFGAEVCKNFRPFNKGKVSILTKLKIFCGISSSSHIAKYGPPREPIRMLFFFSCTMYTTEQEETI